MLARSTRGSDMQGEWESVADAVGARGASAGSARGRAPIEEGVSGRSGRPGVGDGLGVFVRGGEAPVSTASAAVRFEVGARVGPYRIVGELGAGGMGVVYRAVHTLLYRPAAVKVLRPELGACASAVERFRAEACAAAAIRHPGIVHIYDYGYTAAGHAYIAMELLDGQTLGARLAERGRPGTSEALALVRRIASALAAAHDRGGGHRA